MAVAQRRKKHNARPIEGRGSYWRFLPAFYEEADQSEDENERGVLNGLLRIAETILTPLERTIDQIHYYFDPRLAPMAMLPWLAFWVDLVLDENWPEDRRRALISQAAELYRWRGNRPGTVEVARSLIDLRVASIELTLDTGAVGILKVRIANHSEIITRLDLTVTGIPADRKQGDFVNNIVGAITFPRGVTQVSVTIWNPPGSHTRYRMYAVDEAGAIISTSDSADLVAAGEFQLAANVPPDRPLIRCVLIMGFSVDSEAQPADLQRDLLRAQAPLFIHKIVIPK